MNWYNPIARNLGIVLTRFGGVMVTLVFISLLWGEYYAIPAELLSIVIVFSIGSILMYATSSADETSAAQAFASAALVWLIVGVLSALPFALIAWTVAIGPSVLNPPSMSPTLRAFLSPSNASSKGSVELRERD